MYGALKGLRPFDPTSSYGQELLSQTGCFTWNDSGVSVLLPLVAGATLVGLIGLAPEDALSDDDREFAVMVAKELQKGLQLIRSIEAMKTLNMSEFVQKNEALPELWISSLKTGVKGDNVPFKTLFRHSKAVADEGCLGATAPNPPRLASHYP